MLEPLRQQDFRGCQADQLAGQGVGGVGRRPAVAEQDDGHAATTPVASSTITVNDTLTR